MEHSQRITIAIDGFSACGKSTLAKALAKKLDYVFIDSGSMYRCVALYAIENKLFDESGKPDSTKIIEALSKIQISFKKIPESFSNKVFLNEQDVSEKIRMANVASIVSDIATIAEVRSFLVSQQQALGKNGGIIMDGRDVGTVVFPAAELKIFVTADPEVRAQRRFLEQQAKGSSETIEEVRSNLAHRDHLDLTRAIGPLKQAEDAVVLDNSDLSEIEQLEFALKLVGSRIHKAV